MAHTYTRQITGRLDRLKKRRDYLKNRLDTETLPEKIQQLVNGEWVALVWAIEILEKHVELELIGKGEMYWLRQYNELLEKNHRLFGETLEDKEIE